jgi:hypothetical protein
MQSPYRQSSNPENNTVKTVKEDVGKITVEFYYTDKDGMVVCKELVFTGSYGGWDSSNGHRWYMARDYLSEFLSDGIGHGIYIVGKTLIINRSRMIEMRVKTEELIIEVPDMHG